MISSTRSYSFNTRIAPLDMHGKFQDEMHRDLAMHLRGRLMQHDGMSGCEVKDYEMTVHYMRNVITVDAVDAAVAEAIDWAARQVNYFADRGDKTPTATPPASSTDNGESTEGKVKIIFPSYILPYLVDSVEGNYDKAEFNRRIQPIALAIANQDGVYNLSMYLGSVTISYQKRFTTGANVAHHAAEVLAIAAKKHVEESEEDEEHYFPFYTSTASDFTLEIIHS
jgi:hypothetical protein